MSVGSPKQWQCGHCGAWVDGAWGRHVHVIETQPSLDEMRAARERGDDAAALNARSDIVTYTRTGDEPTRDKPL